MILHYYHVFYDMELEGILLILKTWLDDLLRFVV